MVAITVILAAVIGAFVLNIGGNQEAAPQAQFDADFASDGDGFETAENDFDDNVTVSHGGGGTFDASQLSATIAGTSVDDLTGTSSDIVTSNDWSTSTSAGSSIKFEEADSSLAGISSDVYFTTGDDIIISWTSSSGETSQIVFESQFP